jgi:nucleoside-diphosphate-sugar epimerase
MQILVTGGAGFVGSVLVPALLDRGDRVRIVDCDMFGTDHVDRRAELIRDDVLNFRRDWLDGIDAVVHLAGLSNDPMAAFSPSLNYILNASGTAIVAHAAKEAGVRRFVFASSCSVYGLSDAAEIDETHDAKPAFPYAISKLMSERGLGCLEDDRFRPISLRKGTVVGASPRMRFDLVTNAMVRAAISTSTIVVNNPDLWRPLLDVRDAARAYIAAIDADSDVSGIFNVAGENFSIGALAKTVQRTLCEFGIDTHLDIRHQPDLRSYRVSTRRAEAEFGFRTQIPMDETVRSIVRDIRARDLDVDDPRHFNVQQMKLHLEQNENPWRGVVQRPASLQAGTGRRAHVLEQSEKKAA